MEMDKKILLDFSKALLYINNASLLLNSVKLDLSASKMLKLQFNKWISNLDYILKDVKTMVTNPEDRQTIEDDILGDEISIQIDGINEALLQMTKEGRDKIEQLMTMLISNDNNFTIIVKNDDNKTEVEI